MTVKLGDAGKLFEQFSPDLFRQGVINVIDLACIREHALERWDRKAAQVEDYVKRAFRRSVRDTDMLIRLSDTEFVAIQPESTRWSALSCCARVAQETITYFLGAQVHAPLRLLTVNGFSAGEVAAADVAEADIQAALSRDDSSRAGSQTVSAAPAWRDFSSKIGQTSRVVIQVSPKIEALLTLQPIWHTAPGAVASFLIQPTILMQGADHIAPIALSALGPRLSAILCSTMADFAASVMRKAEAEKRRFGLHLPVPIDAITTSRERLAIHSSFHALPPEARQLLVIELCDCPDGMPQSRMIDLVSVVKPFCRAVIARMEGHAPPLARWRNAGLSGIAILLEGAKDEGCRAEMARIAKVADAAAGPRTIIAAHGLRKREFVLAAWASGFTHVSGQVITDQAKTDERPVRLSAADIFVG